MPLYSKADMEADLDLLEMASQQISRMVAEGLKTGLWALSMVPKLEQRRREIKAKFRRSMDIMSDIRSAKNALNNAANDFRSGKASKFQLDAANAAFKSALGRARHNQSERVVAEEAKRV